MGPCGPTSNLLTRDLAILSLFIFHYCLTCLPPHNHTLTRWQFPIKRTVLLSPERLKSINLPHIIHLFSSSFFSFYSTMSGVKILFHQNHINPRRNTNMKIHGASPCADSDSERSSIFHSAAQSAFPDS